MVFGADHTAGLEEPTIEEGPVIGTTKISALPQTTRSTTLGRLTLLLDKLKSILTICSGPSTPHQRPTAASQRNSKHTKIDIIVDSPLLPGTKAHEKLAKISEEEGLPTLCLAYSV